MYEDCVCVCVCASVCVDVSRTSVRMCVLFSVCVGVSSWTDVYVWWAELQFCGCPVGGRCGSYRPSVGGSLPPEPDWARLMYRFNSFSYEQKNRRRTGMLNVSRQAHTGFTLRLKHVVSLSSHAKLLHLNMLKLPQNSQCWLSWLHSVVVICGIHGYCICLGFLSHDYRFAVDGQCQVHHWWGTNLKLINFGL